MDEPMGMAAARAAYEQGRVGFGLRSAPLGLIVGLGMVGVGAKPVVGMAAGVALAGILVGAGWWRSSALEGARAGLWAALVPIVGAMWMAAFGPRCTAAECQVACVAISMMGGGALGLWIGAAAATRELGRFDYVMGALATASLAGLLGCTAVGLGSSLGLAVTLLASTAPGYAVGRKLALQ